MGAVFHNGQQAFLHWCIGEEMDGVDFTKVESDRMVWSWNASRGKKPQLMREEKFLKIVRKRSVKKGGSSTQIL